MIFLSDHIQLADIFATLLNRQITFRDMAPTSPAQIRRGLLTWKDICRFALYPRLRYYAAKISLQCHGNGLSIRKDDDDVLELIFVSAETMSSSLQGTGM